VRGNRPKTILADFWNIAAFGRFSGDSRERDFVETASGIFEKNYDSLYILKADNLSNFSKKNVSPSRGPETVPSDNNQHSAIN
jgi:hypothetical protein